MGATCLDGKWSPNGIPTCEPRNHPHIKQEKLQFVATCSGLGSRAAPFYIVTKPKMAYSRGAFTREARKTREDTREKLARDKSYGIWPIID